MEIKPTTKNIQKIFERAGKKLNKAKIPSNLGGMMQTPYGFIKWSSGQKGEFVGTKKAIDWFLKKLNNQADKFLKNL